MKKNSNYRQFWFGLVWLIGFLFTLGYTTPFTLDYTWYECGGFLLMVAIGWPFMLGLAVGGWL